MTISLADAYPPVTVVVGPKAPVQAPAEEVPLRFTGQAGEYFRIWIINVLLTVLTLGIYSAWAKVKNKQYFYRNTWLRDSSFEYVANPLAVLKGRLVIGAVLGLVAAAQYYNAYLYAGAVVGLLVLMPWVLAKALAFNARNSAYRNVRFSFMGSPGEAYGRYLKGGLVYAVTCGLGMPYLQFQITDYVVTNHTYGLERFRWSRTWNDFLRVFLLSLGVSFAILVPVVIVIAGVVGLAKQGGSQVDPRLITGAVFAVYPLFIIPYAYSRAKTANLMYDGLCIGPHWLRSRQEFLPLLKLLAGNLVGIVLSLGLLVPWAKIRLARYRVECLTAFIQGSLETHANELSGAQAAYGDAMSDLGDMGIDLG